MAAAASAPAGPLLFATIIGTTMALSAAVTSVAGDVAGDVASGAQGGPGTVKWLTVVDPQLAPDDQHSFMNLAQCYSLPRLRDAWARYNIPGFLSLDTAGVWDVPSYPNDCYLMPHGSQCPKKPAPVKTGLTSNWRANLTKLLDAAEPYLRDGSLLGIFLGDELCTNGVVSSH